MMMMMMMMMMMIKTTGNMKVYVLIIIYGYIENRQNKLIY